MNNQISIIIKTFERPLSLKRLLASIQNRGINLPILISDDSKQNSGNEIIKMFPALNITYLPIPFDSGLSAGRNILLESVKTPYFLLCDDDFCFDERADLNRAFNCVTKHNIDILGGDFYNYVTVSSVRTLAALILKKPAQFKRYLTRGYTTSRYLGIFKLDGKNTCELLITNTKPEQSPFYCDLVNNFFIGKTASVKSIGGWDPVLKLGEHEDFFLRAKMGGLKVAYLPDFGTMHFPVIRSNYKKFRLRSVEFKNMYIKKHGFKNYREIMTDTQTTLFENKS